MPEQVTAQITAQQLAQKFHGTPGRGCIVVTGSGIQAISDLFAEPGASRTILEAQVPYSRKALHEFVGEPTEQHVSANEAQLMARAALKRAQQLAEGDDGDQPLFGVGCTAAVATDRVRRGEDRAHIAWATNTGSGGGSIWFDKQSRSRADEDAIVSAIVLNSIAEALGIEERLEFDVLETERFDEID
ncbi:hypothetical protein [Candidatus Lucifugimonas marina]|uniref:CinA C-terminal domain-containing protein n=1 Tax=Candidatus Lucifugimonas marina TaxID=3038979 RepID=A0AAJ6CVC0_9CHLR|nr:hypothetical protein [SAR202 cluster bacterium JH702]MDG0869193.1 hypothetical protein [SAR202 cluster bacterium JH639]WFG35810.1 hypothetical protein GKN94_08925 [SAR202 cluster bacterium JH545]WFG39755.1 hypothetical protein GKO48_09035 [SAR202 cluster bacterium JH1073]